MDFKFIFCYFLASMCGMVDSYKMRNYYDDIKEKSFFYKILLYGVVFLILLNIFMQVLGFRYIAKYKLKNDHNIYKACVYYVGEANSKYSKDYYLFIGGASYNTMKMRVQRFPSGLTWSDFYKDIENNHNSCFNIEYVVVDFFYVKRVFVSDYFGYTNI